jgi:hypothetical protein
MSALWIWLGAAALYAAFRGWYDNWRGPLRQGEIEHFLAGVERAPGAELNDLAVVRSFLEADDGREFLMLNLVRLAPGDVPHPETGAPMPARALMRRYISGFMPTLLRRGGVPALHAVEIGGYFDAWKVPPDPGWTLIGLMRYRSRRDMAARAIDPRFTQSHPFKAAAPEETFPFPTTPRFALLVSPRVWVGLALAAALLQLVLT